MTPMEEKKTFHIGCFSCIAILILWFGFLYFIYTVYGFIGLGAIMAFIICISYLIAYML